MTVHGLCRGCDPTLHKIFRSVASFPSSYLQDYKRQKQEQARRLNKKKETDTVTAITGSSIISLKFASVTAERNKLNKT